MKAKACSATEKLLVEHKHWESCPKAAPKYRNEKLLKANDFKNAIVNYTVALSHASDKLGIYEKRSIVYLADKNYEDALLDYSKIIELEQEQKKLGSAYFYRGLCKIMLHQINAGECEDLSTAKKLGFEAEWKKFTMFCPFIAD